MWQSFIRILSAYIIVNVMTKYIKYIHRSVKTTPIDIDSQGIWKKVKHYLRCEHKVNKNKAVPVGRIM